VKVARVLTVVVALGICHSEGVAAQRHTGADSVARALDTVVVTAERTRTPIVAVAAAVTRLSGEALARLPVRTVADALQYVPGIVVVQGDGIGNAPRIIARGFYGGGDTEYVAVLIDGVPTSEAAGGAVNWDLVPVSALAAIEVVRGGTSSLYGDAAIGGVINLITRDASLAPVQWRVSGGAFGTAQAAGRITTGRASAFGDVSHTDGYRSHEARATGVIGGSLSLVSTPDHALTLGVLSHWRRFEDPGALSEVDEAVDRRATSAFHLFDVTRQNVHRVTLDGRQQVARVQLASYAGAEVAHTDAILTLPLSASFADTKGRVVDSWRLMGSVQAQTGGALWGTVHRIIVGTDASLAELTSTYRPLVSGPLSAYVGAPTLGAPETRGSGQRGAAAGFAEWQVLPVEPLRIDVGLRYDGITDRYSPSLPVSAVRLDESRGAWSPRIGANLRYDSGALGAGSVFASANGGFKAPTMDQLYYQRGIPVPFPPYIVTLSNALLRPQTLRGAETGFQHHTSLANGRVDAALAASFYVMDMRDELDFDLAQFKYVNIGRSRHQGIEASASISGPFGASVFANITSQQAVSRSGDNAGKALRGIPRQALTAGIGHSSANGITATLTATAIGSAFLDDDNVATIAGYTRFDLRTSVPVRTVRLTMEARNLFDRSYNSTGYPDPGGSAQRFFYPAAGRAISVGVASR
jgi:iron complex outermembrane recepter protein